MDDRVEKALENYKKKYNCCQAVACAFSDLVGLDEDIMFKAGEGFGLGMGGMECTCGAVSGAALVAGFKNSDGAIEHPTTKGATCKLSRNIVMEFMNKNGSIICKELKGISTGKILRSCEGCIQDAVTIVEKVLFDENE